MIYLILYFIVSLYLVWCSYLADMSEFTVGQVAAARILLFLAWPVIVVPNILWRLFK